MSLRSGEQSEELNARKLERKFDRLDSQIERSKNFDLIDPDFKLQTSLLGSGYLLSLAGMEGKHMEYEDKDIDLYVPDSKAVRTLEENMDNVYPDEVDELSYINLNRNWRQGAPIELISGMIGDPSSEEKMGDVEKALEEDMEDPFATVYDGEHLEVTMPSPETYAATKKPSNETQKEIYEEQVRTIDYILDASPQETYDMDTGDSRESQKAL